MVLACGPHKVVGTSGIGNTELDGGGRAPDPTGPPGFGVGELTDAGPPPTSSEPRPPSSGEQCAEEAVRGELYPLDLLLVMDASGSMNLAVGTKTRWQLVTEALGTFVRDARSAGMGVGFQTFPFTLHEKACSTDAECGGSTGACSRPFLCIGSGVLPATARTCHPNDPYCPEPGTRCVASGRCSGSSMRCVNLGEECPGGGPTDICDEAPLLCKLPIDSCVGSDYRRPKVPIGVLPAALPGIMLGLAAIRPAGNTPLAAALEGATQYLQRHAVDHPDRRAALVVATDASPSGCQSDAIEAVASVLTAARAGAPSLSTYVIGAVSAGDMVRGEAASLLAQAGGTGTPFILNDSAADLGTRFLDALNAIRGSALPCEFRIPRPTSGMIDYAKVNVRFAASGGADDLLYVRSADRCDATRGGWYYDVEPGAGTPSSVRVCEATCNRFKSQAGGVVELRFGCRTRID